MPGIIEIFKGLSKEEFNKLDKFVKSPYHNKSKKLTKFFREIKKFHPDFSDKKFTKENILKKVSPSLPYNDSTFRNLQADLQLLTEKFLVIEEIFEKEYDTDILLLQAFIKNNNTRLFDIQMRKTKSKLKKFGIDHNYFYTQGDLEMCIFNNNVLNKSERSLKNIELNVATIDKYIIYLISFFVTELINSHLKVSVIEQKYKFDNKTELTSGIIESMDIEKISQHIKKTDKDNFILDLYFHLFLTFRNLNDRLYYLKYKSLVTKHFKSLSRKELSYHYTMFITYFLIQISSGDSRAENDKELFGIFNSFLKEKLFQDSKIKYLNEDLFRNILMLSLKLKKFTWTFKYINDYAKYIHPDKRKNLINLAFAEYYYGAGINKNSSAYLNKAFDHLKEIKEESFVLKHDIKILYLMLYYDLGYTENLFTLLNNHRQFLYRNSIIPGKRKEKLNKFLNILEKLAYLKDGDPKVDITKLNLDIINLTNFNFQNWLLDKIQPFNQKTTFRKLKQG